MRILKVNKKIVKWGIFALLFAVYIGYGAHRCSEESDVIVLDFKEFNSPIYNFPFSKDSVRKALHLINEDKTAFAYRIEQNECDEEEDLFRFLSLGYNTSSYVYVYRKEPKRLVQEHGELEVTLDSLAPNSTRVTVFRPKITVGYGVKLWRSPFQFETFWYKYRRVYIPVIQEYDFLRLIGKHLGYLKQMPYTKYPKELSQQQILQRLDGKYSPFTIEEVFEHPEPEVELKLPGDY